MLHSFVSSQVLVDAGFAERSKIVILANLCQRSKKLFYSDKIYINIYISYRQLTQIWIIFKLSYRVTICFNIQNNNIIDSTLEKVNDDI
jgi:hypothetical protein